VAFDPCKADPNHPSSMPIYQTATFVQPSIERFGPYDYTRSGNPTRTAVEQLLAGLEGAHAAFSFNTGMAALAAVTRLCDAGDEIICGDDIYGGMHRLLSRIVKRYGIKVHFVDLSDADAVAAVLNENTRIVHCESPSNPLMRITDLRRLSAQLKAFSSRIVLSVDSTMMSPYWMQPLRLGADIVVHSATKFLLGHSDTMAGVVCTSSPELSSAIAFVQNAEGTACSPFDCWLILRGLKTLCIRQDRAEENARKVVAFLANHPIVREVYYASYCPPDASGKRLQDQRIHLSQARTGGAVLSFTTGSVRLSRKICDAVHLFKITVSFGSCNSLIEMPCVLSHASIPAEMRSLPEDLLRLSIGIEHYEDLIADLEQAFCAALPEVRTKPKFKIGTTARWGNDKGDSRMEPVTDCQGAPHWDWGERLGSVQAGFPHSERFHNPRAGTKGVSGQTREHHSEDATALPLQAFTNPGDSDLNSCRSGKISLHRKPDGRFGLKVVDGELRTPRGEHRVVSIDGKRLDNRRLIELARRISQGTTARCMMIEKGRTRPSQEEELGAENSEAHADHETDSTEGCSGVDSISEQERPDEECPTLPRDDLGSGEACNLLTAAALSRLAAQKSPRCLPSLARAGPNVAASEISTGASTTVQQERPARSTATFGRSKTDRFESSHNEASHDWPLNPTGPPKRVKGGSIMPPHRYERKPGNHQEFSEIDPKLDLVRERVPSAMMTPLPTPVVVTVGSSCGPGSYDPAPPSPGPCSSVMRASQSRIGEQHVPRDPFRPGPGTYEVAADERSRAPSLSLDRAPRFPKSQSVLSHEIGGYERKPRRRRVPSFVILPAGACLATMMKEIHPDPGTYTPHHMDIHRPDVGILHWSRARDVAIRYAHERLFGPSRREIDNWEVRGIDLASPGCDKSIRAGSVSLVDYGRSAKTAAEAAPHAPSSKVCEDTWRFYDIKAPECEQFTAFFGCKEDFDQWKNIARRRELQNSIARRRDHPQSELLAYSLPELPKGVEVDFSAAPGRVAGARETEGTAVEGDVLMLDPEGYSKSVGGVPFRLQKPRDDPDTEMEGDMLLLSPRKLPKGVGGAIKLDLQPVRETRLKCDVTGVGPGEQMYTTEPPRAEEADDASEECLLHFKERDRCRPLGHLPKWLLRMKQQRRSELPVVHES
ncbi:hypothetical protein FOZ63_025086, partial [Perkinsus olseni]